MVITVTQEHLPHNPNRLHDQLIEAGVKPSIVRSFDDRTEITVEDEEEEAARQAVASYQPPTDAERHPTATDVIVALASMQLENVTTVAALKAAIMPIRDAAAAVVAVECSQ